MTKTRPFLGPDRVPGTISILCRSCVKDCSRRIDGTWRHDETGELLETAGCTDPDTIAGFDRNPNPTNPEGDTMTTTTPEPAALRFLINGRPAAAVHNRLSGIARASGLKGGERLSTTELRSRMAAAGIADPDHEPFEFELPNGVTIAAVLETDAPTAPAKALAQKATPAAKATARRAAAKKGAATRRKQAAAKASKIVDRPEAAQ